MDELYAFLFAGLGIMLLLMVFFGGGISYITDPSAEYKNETFPDNLEWKTIELGTVSLREQNGEKTEILEKEFAVHKGLFAGNLGYSRRFKIDEFLIENMDKTILSFEVKNTNNYGSLSMKLNNETLMNENTIRGKYDFELNSSENNVIEFETSSSGWKIWAPAVYLISNLSLKTEYSFREFPEYDFFVSKYIYNNQYKSELVFDFMNADREFNITFNNKTIYSDIPLSRVTKINLEDIKKGSNKIRFSSDGEATLENVVIQIYYYR
ncbi:MAG: hypothetical protein DRP06_02245 [Candidatus Aenigmatarchaeota archaeon]|nr:MAG: hypothetical protein DRP06_02245 [Candidatus Aenigmarchaeota archaeon]